MADNVGQDKCARADAGRNVPRIGGMLGMLVKFVLRRVAA